MKTGGQKVFYPSPRYYEHEPLCSPEGLDCGANALTGIGFMSAEDARYLALLTPTGLKWDDFLEMVHLAYGRDARWEKIGSEDHLNGILKEGEAMIGTFDWEDGGHYFIVMKMRDTKFGTGSVGTYVIDPQSGTVKPFRHYIEEWADGKFVPLKRFHILRSSTTIHANDEIKRHIIDRVLKPGHVEHERATRLSQPRRPAEARGRSPHPQGAEARGRSQSRRREWTEQGPSGGKSYKSKKSKRYRTRKAR